MMTIVRRLLAVGLAVMMVAPVTAPANHQVLPPLQVSSDAPKDGNFLEELQPPWVDMVAAYIAEDPVNITFTWQVLEIDDIVGIPVDAQYRWEFLLDDPDGVDDPVAFSLSLAKTRGSWDAELETNCRSENGFFECDNVSATIGASADLAQNTVTAKVKRSDLRDPSRRRIADFDGTTLTEIDMFVGLAALQGFVAIARENTATDGADMTEVEDGIYVLGR